MKILLASTVVPFVRGGGRHIVDWLENKLLEYGHQPEKIYLPFADDPKTMLDQMLAFRLMDLSEQADRLIVFRPPSYLLKHPHKVVWFLHQFRLFYDLWNTEYRNFPSTIETTAFRQALAAADNVSLREAKKIFSISGVVANRLKKYNSLDSEILYPPLERPEDFYCEGYGDVVLCMSRIERHKRQHLMVEAMKFTKTPVRLCIMGAPINMPYVEEIRKFIAKNRLQKKIEFNTSWIEEKVKLKAFARCLAVGFVPYDEDYGYLSIEAHYAQKAVITTKDAGGSTELIKDGINGFVVEPDPKAIAEAMDKLYLDRRLAEKMGRSGYHIKDLKITWDHVIERLLT